MSKFQKIFILAVFVLIGGFIFGLTNSSNAQTECSTATNYDVTGDAKVTQADLDVCNACWNKSAKDCLKCNFKEEGECMIDISDIQDLSNHIQLPDLIVKSITFNPDKSAYSKSDLISFVVTFKNVGNFETGSFTGQYYVNDQEFSTTGTILLDSLEPGEETTLKTESYSFFWDNGKYWAKIGDNQFKVIIDHREVVAESDETNNILTKNFSLKDEGLPLRIYMPIASNFGIGETYTIQWAAGEDVLQDKINLDLYKNSVYTASIANSLPVIDKKYSWTIPDSLTTGSGYTIRILDTKYPNYFVESSQFTIIGPEKLTVLSPNGGEKWEMGKSYTISWKIDNFNTGKEVYADVYIKSSKVNQKVCSPQLYFAEEVCTVSVFPGYGTGDDYKVEVVEREEGGKEGVRDASDNYFSIISALPDFTVRDIVIKNDDINNVQYIFVTFKNIGNATAAKDIKVKVTDLDSGQVYSQSLGGGDFESGFEYELQMNSKLILNNSGIYHLKALVDSENVFQESNESNNELTKEIKYGQSNQPPVITGASGPTSLKINEIGTWSIEAYDPDGTYLTYNVDWGDATAKGQKTTTAPSVKTTQKATFTHSYYSAGEYTIAFTATDDKGASAKSTLSVKVNMNQACINEGQRGLIVNNDYCCPNLTQIGNSQVIGDACVAPTDTSFICAYCGNGVCGNGENRCNCSKDCILNSTHIKGNLNAPITLDVWFDYQCPFCSKFLSSIIAQLLTNYSNDVNLHLKHFPLSSIHSLAHKAAEATECANAQNNDYFWKLHDWLISQGTNWNLDAIKNFVASLSGFNIAQFNSCLDNGEKAGLVDDYFNQGVKKDIQGTPTTFIIRTSDGKEEKVVGALPYNDFQTVIDKLLNSTNTVIKDPSITEIKNKAQLLHNDQYDQLRAEIKELRNLVKEQDTKIKYLTKLIAGAQNLTTKIEDRLNNFITYGVDENTKKLGAGERAAVMYSYKNAFNKLPQTDIELEDAIKIANGRWPSEKNAGAEAKAKKEFKKIYLRDADMNISADNAAITVMSYGLRQKAENRNLNSEKAGINIFKSIYGQTPQTTEEWNILQAITYSGASR